MIQREMVSAQKLAGSIQGRLGEEIPAALIARIIELYIQEKQAAMESGKAVAENEVAMRYQIRPYGNDAGGKPLCTVKIQSAIGREYKQALIRMAEADRGLLEAYSERDPEKFSDQLNGHLRRARQTIKKESGAAEK